MPSLELSHHRNRLDLGLALRLSMANHFLKETDGFLAMDDPMVSSRIRSSSIMAD